jgi:hypothetical protein
VLCPNQKRKRELRNRRKDGEKYRIKEKKSARAPCSTSRRRCNSKAQPKRETGNQENEKQKLKEKKMPSHNSPCSNSKQKPKEEKNKRKARACAAAQICNAGVDPPYAVDLPNPLSPRRHGCPICAAATKRER